MKLLHSSPSAIRAAFLVLLFGAIALPLLPVWQGGLRLLAGTAALLAISGYGKFRLAFGILLSASCLISLWGWCSAFLNNPVIHAIHSLTDVFGQPVGAVPDSALLVFDVFTVSALGVILWFKSNSLLSRTFTAGLSLFWLFSLLTALIVSTSEPTAGTFSQAATALSGWATWVYWGFLGLFLFQTNQQTEVALKVIALATLLVGVIVLLQWIVGDYSYYLGALDEHSSPFHRVRGTDYYHAPAALVTAMGSIAMIGVMRGRVETWPSVAAAILVGISILNNTRAISLALSTGLIVLVALMAFRRLWSLSAFALIATLVVMPNVLYLKPASEVQAPAQQTTIQNLTQANSPRSSLASAGLLVLPESVVIGSGPGLLSLPLEGNTFGGLTSTYSTHILYFDLLLMGGTPAFIFIILATIAALVSGLGQSLKDNPSRSILPTAFLGMIITFVIASIFLPQERNELVGVAFALTGLLIRNKEDMSPRFIQQFSTGIPKRSLAVIALVTFLWAIITSPIYVFPAIELIARHGREIIREQQTVFVTDPATKPIVQSLLTTLGGQPSQVQILPDGTYALEHENIWILWSPTRESKYPELVETLKRPDLLPHLYPLGIGTPEHWWVVPSAQPVVTFIFSGARDSVGFGKAVFSDAVPLMDIRLSENIRNWSRNIADRNPGTVISWPSTEPVSIEFTGRHDKRPSALAMYQLIALNHRSIQRAEFYSWTLEGATHDNNWTALDEVINYRVSQNPDLPSRFTVISDRPFERYRFKFKPSGNAGLATTSGLSEIKLHFSRLSPE